MREILFRGKRIDNSKWVEGEMLHDMQDRPHIYWKTPKELPIVFSNHAIVDPATLGQFTGLTDKNGKKIFEGDIIRSDNGKQCAVSVVKFGEYVPKMFYRMLEMFSLGRKHLPSVGFYAKTVDKGEEMILFQSPCVTVIGNIHDNPELLGVTDNA